MYIQSICIHIWYTCYVNLPFINFQYVVQILVMLYPLCAGYGEQDSTDTERDLLWQDKRYC